MHYGRTIGSINDDAEGCINATTAAAAPAAAAAATFADVE